MYRFQKWRQAIQLAPDAATVDTIIAEYLQCIAPSEMARLPAKCQAALAATPPDLQDSAVVLLQEELGYTGDGETAALLHEIAHTFAAASIRLGQIQSRFDPILPK